ncbi:hypothetical protein CDAR_210111 [Caerostris darwini]|uniref:Uncharacterized protein n=1 Tax=Caerostris darwini TaxID=1538125 RepID=A0AAV4SFQ5_9ARAC|nr:hypothetical protein CDAR_210111 [Caerostris darwini]
MRGQSEFGLLGSEFLHNLEGSRVVSLDDADERPHRDSEPAAHQTAHVAEHLPILKKEKYCECWSEMKVANPTKSNMIK